MLKIERVFALFDEADAIYAEGLEDLDESIKLWDRELLRKSAAKTWGAALRATNALILARTGVEPEPDNEDSTYHYLIRLWKELNEWEHFTGRYSVIAGDIYEEAVCEGRVDPVHLLIHDIRETKGYIERAQRLAGVRDNA